MEAWIWGGYLGTGWTREGIPNGQDGRFIPIREANVC